MPASYSEHDHDVPHGPEWLASGVARPSIRCFRSARAYGHPQLDSHRVKPRSYAVIFSVAQANRWRHACIFRTGRRTASHGNAWEYPPTRDRHGCPGRARATRPASAKSVWACRRSTQPNPSFLCATRSARCHGATAISANGRIVGVAIPPWRQSPQGGDAFRCADRQSLVREIGSLR